MKGKSVFLGVAALVLVFTTAPAFAQKYEVTPYAGGFFSGNWREDFSLQDQGTYGLRGGVFLSDRFELEGNFGYIRHFKFEGVRPDTNTNAWLWEIAPTINFFNSRFGNFVPYATVGFGGVTGTINSIDNDDDFGDFFDEGEAVNMTRGVEFIRDVDDGRIIVGGTDPIIMEDGDRFFAISYGGGFKALDLAGPMGLRFDFRGRSMPNFFGNSLTWAEMSGGLMFTWGER